MGLHTAFGDSIRKFAVKADERANNVTKKIIFDISTALVLKSPVGDPKYWKRKPPPGYVGGRFRGNWQYGTNAISHITTSPIDKSGSQTIGRIVGAVPKRVLGDVHYITNSLPYANRLEEGWSWRQAPQGMVQVTILEFDPIVRAAAAEFAT
jgi:hypothetical protein